MDSPGDNNSQKEEGELSDDDNEVENFAHNDQDLRPNDHPVARYRGSDVRSQPTNRAINNVWQNFRQSPQDFVPNYQSSPLSTWEYNHGMGQLRYDRIRPIGTSPHQKWDSRGPRLPNRPPFSPLMLHTRHYNNPAEYRNRPSQQSNPVEYRNRPSQQNNPAEYRSHPSQQNNPAEYRSHPSQQSNRFCILYSTPKNLFL
jgi:hypothetical protein